MKKILVTGFFGAGNLGDDLMLELFSERVKDGCRLTLLRTQTGGTVPGGLRVLDLRKFRRGKSVLISQLFSRWYDGFFWIGGTCLTDRAGDGAYRYMDAFQSRGKLTGYVGIGVNQITDSRRKQAYQRVLSRVDLLTLRDEQSLIRAGALTERKDLPVTEDLVYLCDEIVQPCEKKNRMVIAWRELEHYFTPETQAQGVAALTQFVVRHAEEFEEIIVAPMGNAIDLPVNREIYRLLSDRLGAEKVRFCDEQDAHRRIALLKSARLVITGRLHAIFAAEWSGSRTIALCYDEKNNSFLRSIGREADGLSPAELTVEKMEQVLQNEAFLPDAAEWKHRQMRSEENIRAFLHLLP